MNEHKNNCRVLKKSVIGKLPHAPTLEALLYAKCETCGEACCMVLGHSTPMHGMSSDYFLRTNALPDVEKLSPSGDEPPAPEKSTAPGNSIECTACTWAGTDEDLVKNEDGDPRCPECWTPWRDVAHEKAPTPPRPCERWSGPADRCTSCGVVAYHHPGVPTPAQRGCKKFILYESFGIYFDAATRCEFCMLPLRDHLDKTVAVKAVEPEIEKPVAPTTQQTEIYILLAGGHSAVFSGKFTAMSREAYATRALAEADIPRFRESCCDPEAGLNYAENDANLKISVKACPLRTE